MNTLQKIFEQFIPYLVLGVTIAIGIGLLIMFSYLLLWGLAIGALLWAIVVIKNYFFSNKLPEKKEGRIIEHDKRD